jgi:ferredoxin
VTVPLPVVREPPAVDATTCANARHAGTGCTRCSDVCPAAAFDQSGAAAVPRIDDTACIGCGACIPVCPLDAIGDVRPGRDMSAAVADLPPGEVVLVCRPRRGAEVTVPGHVIDHSRCLAALAPEDLLDLAGDEPRDLWLDDSHCTGCALAVLHGRIADTASDANLLASAIGRPSFVHLVSTTTPGPGPVAPAGGWRDARGGALSRRRLLGGMLRAAAEGPTGEEQPATTGRRRRRLARLEAWERSGHTVAWTDQQVAGSTGLRVDAERCSACDLCARFCPTDALTFVGRAEEGIEQAFELRFRPALCVTCHVCEAACPEHALTLTPRADVITVDDAVTQVVAAGTLGHCTACGSTTLAGRSRCFSCANAVVTTARDEAGLMADLLARAPAPPS